ncbi:demethylmenaquinone methyltransferase [Alicyclobacillus acidoterrestris]|uniref:Demethylmenaquinone methyltransferase n=1 Tax=Alicyclobacillus acidoterrestris (strain ATCC 49025 / DSM 3922 / CIP 106132 / NCIMB 13137 / GD3B) TaxID=1356854 RepID=T0CTD0_ALIAG|nr:demethylmenaquinone methyltransferase [Alicyclobacillus acidoterrestris]EPZ42662.1 ubiquinone/menaquinone biosynthesis methyltransferase [Alicyclobacillus acidoterrestris ATCC 49025]UNO47398.1 demethylmenaquinone methyltransferase [Alicyclobacillus acidoterrestris]
MQGDKAEHVHEVFSKIARRYDVMNSVLSFQQHRLWRHFAMRQLPLRRDSKILDVAAGTGAWTFSMAKRLGPKGHVTGLDFTEAMLEVAQERLATCPERDRIDFIHGNAMDLPFEDNQFDIATVGFALRNMPSVEKCLQEMLRVVKPGGVVVSLELSKPDSALFRRLYYFYFYKVLPRIGSLVVKDDAPYSWLPESLIDFPNRHQLEQMFVDLGMTKVKSYPLTMGIAALHIGYKALPGQETM